MIRNWFAGLVIGCICVCSAQAQLSDDAPSTPSNHDVQSEPAPKRILGIVPNYRSSISLEQYTPIAISNTYYRDNRNASDAATRLGVQISADIVGNVLKEFSPELGRLFSKKHGKKTP
jgi:hypothetical protein